MAKMMKRRLKKVASRKRKLTKKSAKSNPSIQALLKTKNSCPIVTRDNGYNFNFEFFGKCHIKTCQYHTNTTKNNCLMLDMKIPSNGFSDGEVHYYKIQDNPDIPQDEKPKLRTVNLIRKKSSQAIKANIIFSYFVMYLIDNYEPDSSEFIYIRGASSSLDNLLSNVPFKQEGFDQFREWMIPYLFNSDEYEKFCKASDNLQISPSDINLHTVLSLTPVKFVKMQKTISNFCDPSYQKRVSRTLFNN